MPKFRVLLSTSFLFLLIININNCLASEQKDKNTKIEIQELKDKVIALEVKLNLMKEKFNFNQSIIERQDQTINRYISWMSILLALIAIVIPLISYLFVIKPLADAKKKFTSLFDKLNKDNFNKQFKNSIKLLKSENNNKRSQGYKFIYENRYEITRPKHILEIQELQSYSQHDNIIELCKIILDIYYS